MNPFDEELKRALQRVDPPAGFADRVLARAARAERKNHASASKWTWFFGMGGLRWAAACALCVLLAASGAIYEHDLQQRRRGEAAKEQLMLALRITGSKLQIAEQSLQELDSAGQPRR